MTGPEIFVLASRELLATKPTNWGHVGIAARQVMRSSVHRIRIAQTSIDNLRKTKASNAKHRLSLQQDITKTVRYLESKITESTMMLCLEIGATYYQWSNEPYKPNDTNELFRALSCGTHISEIVSYLFNKETNPIKTDASADTTRAMDIANQVIEQRMNDFTKFLSSNIHVESLTATMKFLFPPLSEETYQLIPMLCQLVAIPSRTPKNDGTAKPGGPIVT